MPQAPSISALVQTNTLLLLNQFPTEHSKSTPRQQQSTVLFFSSMYREFVPKTRFELNTIERGRRLREQSHSLGHSWSPGRHYFDIIRTEGNETAIRYCKAERQKTGNKRNTFLVQHKFMEYSFIKNLRTKIEMQCDSFFRILRCR